MRIVLARRQSSASAGPARSTASHRCRRERWFPCGVRPAARSPAWHMPPPAVPFAVRRPCCDIAASMCTSICAPGNSADVSCGGLAQSFGQRARGSAYRNRAAEFAASPRRRRPRLRTGCRKPSRPSVVSGDSRLAAAVEKLARHANRVDHVALGDRRDGCSRRAPSPPPGRPKTSRRRSRPRRGRRACSRPWPPVSSDRHDRRRGRSPRRR